MFRLVSVCVPVLLFTACSGGVTGQVDGESIGTGDVFYVEEDNNFGDDGLFQVYITSMPGGCEAMATWQDEINGLDWADLLDADTYDDLEDLWQETFPEDFWVTTVSIRVDDVDDNNAGNTFDGLDAGDGLADDDEAYASMVHYTEYLDANEVLNNNLSWGQQYVSDGGSGVISGHSPGNTLSGSFDTEMLDDGGDPETDGQIRISWSAPRCDDLEDELF